MRWECCRGRQRPVQPERVSRSKILGGTSTRWGSCSQGLANYGPPATSGLLPVPTDAAAKNGVYIFKGLHFK